MASGYINHPEVGTVTRIENEKVSELSGTVARSGNIVSLHVNLRMTTGEFSNWIYCGTVSLPPKNYTTIMILSDSVLADAKQVRFRVTPTGDIYVFYGGNGEYHANLTYLTA